MDYRDIEVGYDELQQKQPGGSALYLSLSSDIHGTWESSHVEAYDNPGTRHTRDY